MRLKGCLKTHKSSIEPHFCRYIVNAFAQYIGDAIHNRPNVDYYFPKPCKMGRPREHSYRELLNAVCYVVRTACQWRNLPKDFAPWPTVYHYFRLWKRTGLWEHLRPLEGRQQHATAGIIGSQSVKSAECSDQRDYGCGQENQRAQNAMCWYLGFGAAGAGAARQPARPRRRLATAGKIPWRACAAAPQTYLGRWRLCWSAGYLGFEAVALHHRDRQTHRSACLQSVAAPLGKSSAPSAGWGAIAGSIATTNAKRRPAKSWFTSP